MRQRRLCPASDPQQPRPVGFTVTAQTWQQSREYRFRVGTEQKQINEEKDLIISDMLPTEQSVLCFIASFKIIYGDQLIKMNLGEKHLYVTNDT